MSMNKYMHPRNIYKNPPDFKQLAIRYPEFRAYVKQEITGKVTLDFKDVNALRALSRVLLIQDFDLNVEIPVNKLIPTIPLRLNYLLWIEDLLNIREVNPEEVNGIDIGTGASCVYPLIAAKKFKWKMLGTEIDKESAQCARKNVSQNLLEDYVEVLEVTEDSLLEKVVQNASKIFDFCMCNPPFFSSTQELHPFFKARKSSRPHPKNAFCASVNEVVVNGGEIEFISKLIKESKILKDHIIIFTTMIGHKSSLAPLKTLLREIEVCSFKQTEFCQGRTTRWGLAWTFKDIDLRTIPITLKKSKSKHKPPLNYILPNLNDEMYTIEHITKSIYEIIENLKLEVLDTKKSKGSIIYELIAHSNTWSNQRRKRREKLHEPRDETQSNINDPNSLDSGNSSLQSEENLAMDISTETEKNVEMHSTSDKLSEMNIASTTPKREHEDDDEYYNNKKFKDTNMDIQNNYLAKFFLAIKKQNSEIVLELFSLDAGTNRETLHQILQYIKNNSK